MLTNRPTINLTVLSNCIATHPTPRPSILNSNLYPISPMIRYIIIKRIETGKTNIGVRPLSGYLSDKLSIKNLVDTTFTVIITIPTVKPQQMIQQIANQTHSRCGL